MKIKLIQLEILCLLFPIFNATASVLYVDSNSPDPVSPYANWETAATNIQDAIEAAVAGDTVIVTNGIYATGGKSMGGANTNRVAVDKAIIVQSVNGPGVTIIQGAWDPISTNGLNAVRCAYVTNGATLSGFTLQNGATGAGDFGGDVQDSGGGAWCVSTNGIVSNCILTNDIAIYGGGVANGTLENSLVVGNIAIRGGGAYDATLNNCTVVGNYIETSTIGIGGYGGGTYNCAVRNSIVVINFDGWPSIWGDDNYYYDVNHVSAKYSYSCTHPLFLGTGNVDVSPQFLDLFHIATTSPCLGAGSVSYASGTDLDGESWNNPPSMGCDEVIVSNLVGPLTVNISAPQTNVLVSVPGLYRPSAPFFGVITGRAAYTAWSFGDGLIFTNLGSSDSYRWTNTGDYTVTFTAYNNDNPAGVSTNVIIHVLLPAAPQLQSPVSLADGFQFQFPGQLFAYYTVQYTTNLTPPVVWQTLQTDDLNYYDVVQINDNAATNTARFYRVLAQ